MDEKMKIIRVKAFYSGWHEVSREQAERWAEHLWNGSTGIRTEKKPDYINGRLEGVTVQELLPEKFLYCPE